MPAEIAQPQRSKLADNLLEEINKSHAAHLVDAIDILCDQAESNPHSKPLLEKFFEERLRRLKGV